MRKLLFATLCLTALLACVKQPDDDGGDDTPVDPPVPVETDVETPDFARGADVSWVSEMESSG